MKNERTRYYRSNREINKEINRTGKCNHCGRCCKFALLGTLNTSEQYKYFSGFVDYIKIDGERHIIINKPCKHLTKDNKCSIFNSKKLPMACRQFPIINDTVYQLVKKTCGFKIPEKKKDELMAVFR